MGKKLKQFLCGVFTGHKINPNISWLGFDTKTNTTYIVHMCERCKKRFKSHKSGLA